MVRSVAMERITSSGRLFARLMLLAALLGTLPVMLPYMASGQASPPPRDSRQHNNPPAPTQHLRASRLHGTFLERTFWVPVIWVPPFRLLAAHELDEMIDRSIIISLIGRCGQSDSRVGRSGRSPNFILPLASGDAVLGGVAGCLALPVEVALRGAASGRLR